MHIAKLLMMIIGRNLRCWQIKLRFNPQLVSDQSQPFVPSNLAQLSLPPGRFQKDTETGFPSIHFQFLGSSLSLTAPIQYWPLASPLCRLQSSHDKNPCNAGFDSSTNDPPRDSQKSIAPWFWDEKDWNIHFESNCSNSFVGRENYLKCCRLLVIEYVTFSIVRCCTSWRLISKRGTSFNW